MPSASEIFGIFFPNHLNIKFFGIIFPNMEMQEQTLRAMNQALRKVLTPLVRVMIRFGFSYGTFSEIARSVFVEQAYQQLQREDQKATASAVAALTGLSRKEVSRLTKSDDAALVETEQKRNRAAQLMSGWSNDPDFSSEGLPKRLLLTGDSDSFAELVRRYGSDVTSASMLALLTRNGAVESDGNTVCLLSEAYIPMGTPIERLEILGTDANELITTIAHNIDAASDQRVFQRKVSVDQLSADDVADFRAFSDEQSQALLETYDAWLTNRARQLSPADEMQKNERVSVGIYFYASDHAERSILKNSEEGEQK